MLRFKRYLKRISLFALTAIVLGAANVSAAEGDWFLSIYGGRVSDTAFNEVIRFNTRFKDYYLAAVALGKELWNYKDTVALEAEGQIVQHFQGKAQQEFNGALILRWLPFPWDDYLDTSVALGNGLSYATRDPEFEENTADDNETSQVLYYLMAEAAFGLPGDSHWAVFTRVHHRSSVFGLINGEFAASNYVCAGIRYRF